MHADADGRNSAPEAQAVDAAGSCSARNPSAADNSTDGVPIAGLYAAGELVGGIFYFNYPGGTGLTNGAVFGRIAGANAAAAAKSAR